jgi:hypothetical protein
MRRLRSRLQEVKEVSVLPEETFRSYLTDSPRTSRKVTSFGCGVLVESGPNLADITKGGVFVGAQEQRSEMLT